MSKLTRRSVVHGSSATVLRSAINGAVLVSAINGKLLTSARST
jgi:hypothetical protein